MLTTHTLLLPGLRIGWSYISVFPISQHMVFIGWALPLHFHVKTILYGGWNLDSRRVLFGVWMSADLKYRITPFVVKLPTLRVKTDIIYQLKEVESLYRSPVAQQRPKPNIVPLTLHHSSLTDKNNLRYASNLPRAHAFASCVNPSH